MAPSSNITASRVLHVSAQKAISQAPQISALTLKSSADRSCTYQSLTALPSASRCFWWGRNGHRSKALSSTATYHRCLEGQQRIAKYKTGTTSLPPLRSGYPIYYCRGQGWRLASSWGQSDGKTTAIPSNKSRVEAEKENEMKSEAEKWQEELNTYLERLRKRVEKYPYETIFGSSIKNGVWNPWESHWNAWTRGLAKEEWSSDKWSSKGQKCHGSRSGASTTQAESKNRPTPIDQHKTTTGLSSNSPYEDFDIDLITLRRVQRKTPTLGEASSKSTSNASAEVSVKTFKPLNLTKESTPKASNQIATSSSPVIADGQRFKNNTKTESPRKPSTSSEVSSVKGSIAEKIGSIEDQLKTTRRMRMDHLRDIATFTTQKEEPSKLETTLERTIRKLNSSPLESNRLRTSLEYKAEENKTEDIDLLRASNVRASSGRLQKPVPEQVETRDERRAALKAKFEAKQKNLETQYAEEVTIMADAEIPAQEAKDLKEHGSRANNQAQSQNHIISGEKVALNKISSEAPVPLNVDTWGFDRIPKGLENSYQDELDNNVQSRENHYAQQRELLEAECQKKHQVRNATDAILEAEIQSQKAAMAALVDRKSIGRTASEGVASQESGEGDMSSNVHEFAGRDRWYKRKAPHALERNQKKAQDTALVCEIRNIYEEQYGVIDTKHIQPRSSSLMEGKEDPAVQEGLREYDEKNFSKADWWPTKGKIAATDLSSYEISLLSRRAKSSNLNPSPSVPFSQEQAKVTATPVKNSSTRVDDTKPGVSVVPKTHTYKVLALDQITQKVLVVTTATSLYESSSPPRSIPAILSHLKDPARYFDHFDPLEAAGYELVAGSRNALVFKKVREVEPAPTKAMQDTINNFLQNDPSALNIVTQQENSQARLAADTEAEIDSNRSNGSKSPSVESVQQPLSSAGSGIQGPIPIDNLISSISKDTLDVDQSFKHLRKNTVDEPPERTRINAIRSLKPPTGDLLGSTENDRRRVTPWEKPTPITSINPIDGTTASYQSTPTPESSATALLTETSPSPPRKQVVHREEEVFTGHHRDREQYRVLRRQQRLAASAERYQKAKEERRRRQRRIFKVAKRIALTGTWVAACFYLVGALWEEVYRPKERRRMSKRS